MAEFTIPSYDYIPLKKANGLIYGIDLAEPYTLTAVGSKISNLKNTITEFIADQLSLNIPVFTYKEFDNLVDYKIELDIQNIYSLVASGVNLTTHTINVIKVLNGSAATGQLFLPPNIII